MKKRNGVVYGSYTGDDHMKMIKTLKEKGYDVIFYENTGFGLERCDTPYKSHPDYWSIEGQTVGIAWL